MYRYLITKKVPFMKPFKLLTVLIAMTLAGCNTTSASSTGVSNEPSESSGVFIPSSVSSIEPESSSDESSSTSSSSSSSSTSSASSSSSSSSKPDSTGSKHKVVTFRNGGFTNSSLEQPNSKQQFVDWFNGEENQLLNSINYEAYAQLNYIGNTSDSWRFSTLILGSSSSNGKITFNFSVDVISLKVVVQPYTKYITYTSTYNIDTGATFLVDTKEYDLSLEEGYQGETENVNVEYIFTTPKKSFSISNKEANQRVFVHSMDILYKE